MTYQTVYVDPEFLRTAGDKVSDLASALERDADTALRIPGKSDTWEVEQAARSLGRLWHNYLSGYAATVNDLAGWLVDAGDAYRRCDEEAANDLGLALPADGPVVKPRPGHVPE